MIFDTEYGKINIEECDLNMFKDMLGDNISNFAKQSEESKNERRRSRFKLTTSFNTTKVEA